MAQEKEKSFYEKVAAIQKSIVAPKSKANGAIFKSRSCEEILEAVKPLLGDLILTISDELVLIGDRYYIKATAIIFEDRMIHGQEPLTPVSISATAYAREPEEKFKMDLSQITGAASSYARKYALSGLFLVDGHEPDPDTPDPMAVKRNDLLQELSGTFKDLTEMRKKEFLNEFNIKKNEIVKQDIKTVEKMIDYFIK